MYWSRNIQTMSILAVADSVIVCSSRDCKSKLKNDFPNSTLFTQLILLLISFSKHSTRLYLIMGSLTTDLTKIPSAFLLQDSISLVGVEKEMSRERF